MLETTSVQEAQKPKFKTTFFLVLLLIFTMSLLFIGYKLGKKQINLTTQPIPTPTASVSSTPDLTANWKTVSDASVGISFKYPEDIFPYADNQQTVSDSSYFGYDAFNNKEKRGWRLLLENDLQLEVVVYKPFKDSVEPYLSVIKAADNTIVTAPFPGNPYTKVKTITEGKTQKAIVYAEPEKEFPEYDAIIVDDNKGVATIRLMSGSHNKRQELLPIIEKISSTFLFSSQNSETANWKTYTNTKYGFSIKYPENYSAKEWTSQYDDTFSVWFTDQPRDTYPRGLEKGKTDITIVAGGRNFTRQDSYYGGFNWTFPIVRSMSSLANLATNEYGTKIKDTNMGDGNFFGVEYKVTKPTLLDTSLNIALSSDGEGRTFLISGKTGQPNDIFIKPYSDIVDNMFSTMVISSPGPLPTPTPTPKLINYSVDSFKISFSYFENFIPDLQEIYNENRSWGRLVFNKKSDPKKVGGGERDRLIIDVWKNKAPYYQEGFLEREIKLPIGQSIEWPKELVKIDNILIDGKPGVKAQGTAGRSNGIATDVGDPCSVLFARIATETDVYEIRSEVSTASPQSVKKEFDDLFNLVISTLKFL